MTNGKVSAHGSKLFVHGCDIPPDRHLTRRSYSGGEPTIPSKFVRFSRTGIKTPCTLFESSKPDCLDGLGVERILPYLALNATGSEECQLSTKIPACK